MSKHVVRAPSSWRVGSESAVNDQFARLTGPLVRLSRPDRRIAHLYLIPADGAR